MKRFTAMMLALLIAGNMTALFFIMPARAVGTVYIHSDGSIDPPSTPITTIDLVTYTLTGDIGSSITIERSSIVVDGKSHFVRGDGTGEGFKLVGVDNVTIKNARIENFTYGIYVESASLTRILENNITANTYDGVGVFYCSNTTISSNIITLNEYDGIEYFTSSYGNITGNYIASNIWFALGVYYSSDNNIIENRLVNNYKGMELIYSPDNSIFHNNFINHTLQAFTEFSTDTWDNGRQGNHWSDYNGTDANGDEIGDTPYVVDENNVDDYPLMYIYWNPCDVNRDLKVDMRDIAIIAKAFGTIPGYPNWDPRADITSTVPLVPDGRVDMRDIGLVAKNFGKKILGAT
jgi:parallel beta-helix repeat protein